MSGRAILAALAIGLPLLILGAFLWSSQGVTVWLQSAILYCL